MLKIVRDCLDLLKLEKNWDGYNADPISKEIVESAIRFVASVPSEVFGNPQVVPSLRCGLQFEWYAGDRSLELEFENPREIRFLQCDDKRSIEEERIIPIDSPFAHDLIRWVQRG